MINKAPRHTILKVALDFLPPRVRSSLLDDQVFVETWDLAAKISVTLGKDGPSFQRDQLYESIREAIRQFGKEVSIKDEKAVMWTLSVRDETEQLSFCLDNGDMSYTIPDHSGLAETQSIRMAWFDRASNDLGFDGAAFDKWNERIGELPLGDDEFLELIGEMELTPVRNYRKLQTDFAQGSIDMDTVVPGEQRYYDRLVGSIGSATSASSYIAMGAVPLIERLQKWETKLGFLMSLLMCSKGSVSESIKLDEFDVEHLLPIYEWIASQGDPISQIGAVEVALMNIERHRELEPSIERMVEGFISDDPNKDGGCFSLLSAMIVFVSSELGRRRILEGTHPFYRRQAAIAQASLVIRAIKGSQVDPASVIEWTKTGEVGQRFYLQGLVDLRVEPRWLPDFVSPSLLRAEFIGRVRDVVARSKKEICSQSLSSLLLGSESRLTTAAEWPLSMLPGPLEGEIAQKRPDVPNEILTTVNGELEAEYLEPKSFTGLVNAALLFDMSSDHANLAATALQRVKYSIVNADDDATVFGLIGGLATVAAVTRSTDLAETLRVLMRVMRRRKKLHAAPGEELRIAMVAAASLDGLEEWARFAGEWITEICMEVVEMESAQWFLPKIRRLVQIEPALARHCAIADAALSSVVR